MENTGWVMPTHIIAGAGIVINKKEEVLLVKTHNAGWVFPGGQVEVGENVIDAVKREIMEETGIDIEVGEVFCISSFPDGDEVGAEMGRSYRSASLLPEYLYSCRRLLCF